MFKIEDVVPILIQLIRKWREIFGGKKRKNKFKRLYLLYGGLQKYAYWEYHPSQIRKAKLLIEFSHRIGANEADTFWSNQSLNAVKLRAFFHCLGAVLYEATNIGSKTCQENWFPRTWKHSISNFVIYISYEIRVGYHKMIESAYCFTINYRLRWPVNGVTMRIW